MREFFTPEKVPKCKMEKTLLTNWNFSPQERLELSPRNKLELFSPGKIGTFSPEQIGTLHFGTFLEVKNSLII